MRLGAEETARWHGFGGLVSGAGKTGLECRQSHAAKDQNPRNFPDRARSSARGQGNIRSQRPNFVVFSPESDAAEIPQRLSRVKKSRGLLL